MASESAGSERRSFLGLTAAALGALGLGFTGWQFAGSMAPAAGTRLYKLKVDLATVPYGKSIVVPMDRKPIFIRHRTDGEIAHAADVDLSELRDPQTDTGRFQDPRWVVLVGICPAKGCVPLGSKVDHMRGKYNGWFCPCCASHFDTSGRVRIGIAPRNLAVPSHDILDGTTLGLRSVPHPPDWPT